MNFTETPTKFALQNNVFWIPLSSLFEEIGIYYKYSNIIHCFEEKNRYIAHLNICRQNSVFKNLLRTQEAQASYILVKLFYWDSAFKETLLLSLCFSDFFFFLPMFLLNASISIQIKTTHYFQKKYSQGRKVLGNTLFWPVFPCCLSVQHWYSGISWVGPNVCSLSPFLPYSSTKTVCRIQ